MRRTIEKSTQGSGRFRSAKLVVCDRARRRNLGDAVPCDPLGFIPKTELFLEKSINCSTSVNACQLVEGIRRNLHPEMDVESKAAPRKPTQAYYSLVIMV
jgi:hypothetical protein